MIELRPHHVSAYKAYLDDPSPLSWPDEKYISAWRNEWGKGDYHSDELVLHWRDTMKALHENPELRFKYVKGLDSVCGSCDKSRDCTEIAEYWDKRGMDMLPGLKFGEVYTSAYLENLLRD